jgi:hypothetical protein
VTYARFATAAGVEIPPNLTEAIAQMGYTHDRKKSESLARQVPDNLIRDATLVGVQVPKLAIRLIAKRRWSRYSWASPRFHEQRQRFDFLRTLALGRAIRQSAHPPTLCANSIR